MFETKNRKIELRSIVLIIRNIINNIIAKESYLFLQSIG